MPNVDLLRRTLAHIEAHPDEWDQGMWRCGSTACFAGHAAMLAGARWAKPEDDYDTSVVRPDGVRDYVDLYAQEALGLNDWQAGALFGPGHDLVGLRELVAELCGEVTA